jgi:pyruvate/2-oxoglutarate dehydrogenase complex dihydrolipoamide dehydrogenase (E3) component
MREIPELLPKDAHNATLLANVHPPDWVNPAPAGRYNLVVIGAGTAGLVSAAGAAGLGARVALVERHLLGGDCLNVGCVPSKTVIRSSRVMAELRDAARLGVRVPGDGGADFGSVMERMRAIRARISHHDSVRRFSELGVDVFLGGAAFTGPRAVEVDGTTLRFRKAVIATGARAARPPIPGLDAAGYLTNETVFSLTERPARVGILGGGPIGCEFAQAFRRLGCEVTLVDNQPQFLTREDPDAAALLADTFRHEGIRVKLGTNVTRVESDGREKRLHLETPGEGRGLSEVTAVDEILVGVGRAPNVEDLGLERAGVAWSARGVRVNDRLQTTNPDIYAAGDVCLEHKFTHMADASARIVIQNALFLGRRKASALTIPWSTYTDPEIAHVGMYERDARARSIAVDTFIRPLAEVDRAITDGEETGFVKIHVRRGTDRILGATIVARHAGDLISEITLAIAAGVGLGRIAGVIHPYPTQAEAIRQVGDLYNRTRLTPFVQKLFRGWLALTR